MRYYRRVFLPGATYFFTLNLQNRKSDLLIKRIEDLRFAFKRVQQNHPFYINAIVILPDHCHFIITLPGDDAKYPQRIGLIKSTFSRQIGQYEIISSSRANKRERGIWQRRYWEHVIQNETDYEHHVNYIHYNPVKHGYVKKPSDWQYSSIHRYIANNVLEDDWGYVDDGLELGRFGE